MPLQRVAVFSPEYFILSVRFPTGGGSTSSSTFIHFSRHNNSFPPPPPPPLHRTGHRCRDRRPIMASAHQQHLLAAVVPARPFDLAGSAYRLTAIRPADHRPFVRTRRGRFESPRALQDLPLRLGTTGPFLLIFAPRFAAVYV